tara:strand:- start:384 stop:683 length:300 start_codon:yes stop_codon:yes gene_type:complete
MFLNEVHVWEVSTYEYTRDEDDNLEVGECVDNLYLVTTTGEVDYNTLIQESQLPTEGLLVQVYSARTASLTVNKNNSVEVYEADCSTGYSGSPVFEEER